MFDRLHMPSLDGWRREALQLTVSDIDVARDGLIGGGADVSEVFHDAGGVFHHAGIEARVTGPADDHADLAEALTRAKDAHTEHEERTGEADPEWPAWYAEYMVREQTGGELPA